MAIIQPLLCQWPPDFLLYLLRQSFAFGEFAFVQNFLNRILQFNPAATGILHISGSGFQNGSNGRQPAHHVLGL